MDVCDFELPALNWWKFGGKIQTVWKIIIFRKGHFFCSLYNNKSADDKENFLFSQYIRYVFYTINVIAYSISKEVRNSITWLHYYNCKGVNNLKNIENTHELK